MRRPLGTIPLEMNKNIVDNINLTDSFEKEIFNKTVDLSIDYGEIAIDIISTSEIIKEIPTVKSLYAFYNIGSSINSRYNIKKMLVFLSEFHSHNIENEKLEKFKEKINNDNKYRNELLETTLVLIEKFIDMEKSRILANLLKAHIEEKISWQQYQELSFILNQLNPSGYKILIRHFDKSVEMKMSKQVEGEAYLLACGIGTIFEDQLRINVAGRNLYCFGLKPIKERYCA